MTARFIVRLVDDAGALLSWAEVSAEAKPQGRPRSTPLMALCPTQFVIERDGIASQLVIHWADMDVVRATRLMERTPVQAGQLVTFTWLEPVWMVHGAQAVNLPAYEGVLRVLSAERAKSDSTSPESEGLDIAIELVTDLLQLEKLVSDIPLAPVTVRGPVRVGIPAGGLGAVGTA